MRPSAAQLRVASSGGLKARQASKNSCEHRSVAIICLTMKTPSHVPCAILVAAFATAPFCAHGESSSARPIATGRFIDTTLAKMIAKPQPLAPLQPNPVVQSLPREIVDSLSQGITRPLPKQLVRSLPGQMIRPLPGQIVRALPGQIIQSLPGQIVQ